MMGLLEKFGRKKVIDRDETCTQLNRVLTTIDLTMLGIGSTLGIGVYVLAGSVAKESAGPAVVISFLIAAFASVLAARVPKAGSAYVYSYVCVGELIAFIVGWNLIMEYVIGVASVAKGYSGYVDQLFDHSLSRTFNSYLPVNVGFLSDYFDLFAFSITLVLTVLLAFGVKESSLFNNIFTVLNLGVVLFVIVAGSIYAKPNNWFLSKEFIMNSTNITSEKVGEGGFAPFGLHGIMKGAATCFYGFVGFDCIATTGEEAKNPQRSIPLAIIFSLIFIFLAYFGISTVITMMVPYYLQDAEAPLPQAFLSVGFTTGQWIVTVGALFGLSTSLLGAMFPMPRVIYAMASDGVLFKFLSKVNPRFQTPLVATLVAGTFGGIMAALFKLEALIDMMSIGTLTAYTLVAICVLCLRYRKDVDGADDNFSSPSLSIPVTNSNFCNYLEQSMNKAGLKIPTDFSSSFTNLTVILYCVFVICFCALSIFAEDEIFNGNLTMQILLGIFGSILILLLVSLSLQPVSRVKLTFRVPLVPIVPGISILINTYLIMKLSGLTWIRFAVWMALGFIIYAICLINGTTDLSYQASLDERKKRKYSRVSASGFDNKGLEDGPVIENGSKSKIQENTTNYNGKIKSTDDSTTLMSKILNGEECSSLAGQQHPKEVNDLEEIKPIKIDQDSLEPTETEFKVTKENSADSVFIPISNEDTPEITAAQTVDKVISLAWAHPSVVASQALKINEDDQMIDSYTDSESHRNSEEAIMTFSEGSSEETSSFDGPIMNTNSDLICLDSNASIDAVYRTDGVKTVGFSGMDGKPNEEDSTLASKKSLPETESSIEKIYASKEEMSI